ncbi:glycosyltransferase family 4 protein [Roseateles saccharophilus]|nr:glycosyltransferase family 4 protein [Roseateles saccharophilus]
MPPEQRAEMGERGRVFAMAHHAYPVLAARFIQALA